MTPDTGENIRFRLLVNGDVKGTAGLASVGVLSQTLSWVRRDTDRAPIDTHDIQEWVCNKMHLRLGGLDSTRGEHLVWFSYLILFLFSAPQITRRREHCDG
jgi:hypothetical protein